MNQRISWDELMKYRDWSIPTTFTHSVMMYGSFRAVPSQYNPKEVIIISECEYCRTSRPSLDRYDCCIHCGGPVE